MENIITAVFEVESEGYQAITELGRQPVTDDAVILQMALVKREGSGIRTCESFDSGIHTTDDTVRGGLIGGFVGILGGPIGMLLSHSAGVLVGSVVDAKDAEGSDSLIEMTAGKLQEGEIALIILAEENRESGIDRKLGKYRVQVNRHDAAVVAQEVEEAEKLEKEMERQARAQMRAAKKEDRKKAVEEKRAKIRKDIDDFKNRRQEKKESQNGTLKKVKQAMRSDRDLRKMLVRGGRSEILIDLDGDREADLGLFDSTGNGNIDTLAADVLDTGEFNLVILDRDDNGIPDAVYLDEEGTGNYEELAVGPEVEAHMLEAAHKLAAVMEAREIIAVELEGRLRDLEKDVRAARKELKAGR